jgi:N6-L-threonylcarbamoyladenine synthase
LINFALLKEPIILAIESSCDDTSAAIARGTDILSNLTAGQAIHEQYGGVVPELASRAHERNIIPVVDAAIKAAGITVNDIDAVAFTRGPGLIGSLLVGSSFAKAFALVRKLPLLEVNHMQAHILAHFITSDPVITREIGGFYEGKPKFPFLCLTVSGGHTQLVVVKDYFDFEIVGETLDDAAGEAFDKTAKLLGLPYPGGPLVDKYAELGNPDKFKFAKARVPDFNYSFSGLKTSVLYFLQAEVKNNPNFVAENLNDLCASIRKTIVAMLIEKLQKAATELNIKHLAISGGVSANKGLRTELNKLAQVNGYQVFIPPIEYCTDNAAMIAITGYFKYIQGIYADQSATPVARYPLA